MTRLFVFTFLLLTTFSRHDVFGQERKSDKEFKEYSTSLQFTKIDTVLVIKSGCTGCDVIYKGEPKSVIDGQTIYVLTKKSGQFKLAIFDDIHNPKYFTMDTCSIFKFITQNKAVLEQKEKFYKSEIPKIKSKSGFYPPSPIHYSYEELNIKLPNLNYDFTIVDNKNDRFGLQRDNEKWFALTNQIIKRVYNIN